MTRKRVLLPEFWVDEETPALDEALGSWHLAKLRIQEFHQRGLTGKGITIGVVDTGVAPHPGLDRDQIEVLSVLGSTGTDFNGHGTSMIGILAGRRGAIAPGSKIVSVRAVSATGGTSSKSLVQGMTEALKAGADIVCVSVADTQATHALVQLVQNATEAGKVIVGAAGNDFGNWVTAFPASLPPVLAVTATDMEGSLIYETPPHWVDVSAPGKAIPTTVLRGKYADVTGTSPATAVIAGVCALLLGMVPPSERASLGRVLPNILKRTGDAFPDAEPGTCVRLNGVRAAQFIAKELPR